MSFDLHPNIQSTDYYVNLHWENYISISFRFWTKWNSIWFKIERQTLTTIMPHSMWKEIEYEFSQCTVNWQAIFSPHFLFCIGMNIVIYMWNYILFTKSQNLLHMIGIDIVLFFSKNLNDLFIGLIKHKNKTLSSCTRSFVHTEKSFRNLVESNQNQTLFTIFRLICK